MENNKIEFGKVRSVLFPIHKTEFRKFIPLSLVFFFICFVYSALRNLKDMFMLEYAGAEAIYYTKVVGVLPFAILYTILYSRLSRTFGRDGRFNTIVAFFLVFYIVFRLFLFPYLSYLQLDGVADYLIINYPKFTGLWEAIRNWPIALFYINSETWGTFCLSIIFWTFANEITGVHQAKRFYSFLAISANIGLLLAGTLLKSFGKEYDMLLGVVLVCGVLLLIVYNMFSRDIAQNPELYQVVRKPKKTKVKLSFTESFKFLLKSKYLGLIAILVLSYGMVISLFESVWKSQIRELFATMGNDKSVLGDIYANFSILTAVVTILFILFLSAPIMKKGWRFAASVTPTIAGILSIFFFAFIIFGDQVQGITNFFNTNALFMAVMFGLGNVVFIKASKYTLFDPTKERSYIPLDEESKIRGKAAVDGVGARLGKSLGAFILTGFLVPFVGDGLITNVKQYLFFVIIAIIIMWIVAARKLSVLFEERMREKDKEDKA